MPASITSIEHLYRRRAGDYFRFAYARSGDPEAARDAVQEGFARALRARGSFRGVGSLDAWVGRCVINAARDIERRRERMPASADAAGDLEPGVVSRAVRDAVLLLPRRQRDVLFLRFYLDWDYKTIADAVGVEVGTVSATLHAARARLHDLLQEVAR